MIIVSFDVGIRNLAYCIVLFKNDATHIILEWKKVDLGCAKHDMQGLTDSLLELLDDILYTKISILEEDQDLFILIEHQMTSVMKCLQATINTYFKVIAKYQSSRLFTRFVSPKLKLKLISQYPEYQSLLTNITNQSKSKYKQNKVDSVSFCKWYLEKMGMSNMLNVLQSEKKADDLSDVYLQAIAWHSAYKSI